LKAPGSPSVAEGILALESAALRRWCRGDPSGFLDICADDVVYFDPFLDRRIEGRTALTAYYETLRGKVGAARHEILAPIVQHSGTMAVLTFQFASSGGGAGEARWNCTEAYRLEAQGWRIIQTHWSFTGAGR
jgi:ketosteroid isomerase-like protein